MDLRELVNRPWPPAPWSEGGKIPWHDEAFSERMLAEHLSQDHDLASRRNEYIDFAVEWVHRDILHSVRSKILDLGCGPGLYSKRFAQLGHQVTGIDIGPASIRYAKESTKHLDVELVHGDITQVPFGDGYDLVAFLFGEINVFPPNTTELVLRKARAAGRRLVIEVQTAEMILSADLPGRRWDCLSTGLFCPEPHLLLTETSLDEEQMAMTTRFICIRLRDGETSIVSQSDRVLRLDEWTEMLKSLGWKDIERGPQLGPETEEQFITLVAS